MVLDKNTLREAMKSRTSDAFEQIQEAVNARPDFELSGGTLYVLSPIPLDILARTGKPLVALAGQLLEARRDYAINLPV